MGYVQLSTKTLKIRKERRCPGCAKKYAVGTEMRRTVGVMDSELQNTYWCLPCDEFLKDKWNEIDDGIAPGECWEWDDYKQFRENFLNNLICKNEISSESTPVQKVPS